MEGVPTVGEPRVMGGVGCHGIRGTDLPLRLATGGSQGRTDAIGGPARPEEPCAAILSLRREGTRVHPNALACFAIVLTLRSRYCAS